MWVEEKGEVDWIGLNESPRYWTGASGAGKVKLGRAEALIPNTPIPKTAWDMYIQSIHKSQQ